MTREAGDVLDVRTLGERLSHLGYPTYCATILGTWELLGAAAIVAPDLPRLKEWAYAAMFLTLTGAALSHAASGDPVGKILAPLLVLGAVVVSWTFRPARRTLPATEVPPRASRMRSDDPWEYG